MTEQEIRDYNKWLMEVWNPNQLYIPFENCTPKAYFTYLENFYCNREEKGFSKCNRQCGHCKNK